MNTITTEQVLDKLNVICDPEIPISIVELGLIYDILIQGQSIKLTMTLTNPMCPMSQSLLNDIRNVLMTLNDIKAVEVDITWDPPWSMDKLSDTAKLKLGIL